MVFTTFIRGIVKRNPELKAKLRRGGMNQTPFQYVYQSFSMTVMTYIAFAIIVFFIFRSNMLYLAFAEIALILITPGFYLFWMGFVDVKIRQHARELEEDLLFVSEYFLVSLESGLPLGNAIQRLAKVDRPGGKFFKQIYTDFKTGKDLETALDDAAFYSPSDSLKTLLKRLKDSLVIGVDLRIVLENFIVESSEKKIVSIRAYSKKLNPIIMMYLLLGVVLPSLGLTFFILGAALVEMTPELLKYILILCFLLMFAFQYISFSIFSFNKSTL